MGKRDTTTALQVHDSLASSAGWLPRIGVGSAALLNQLVILTALQPGQDECVEDGAEFSSRGSRVVRHVER